MTRRLAAGLGAAAVTLAAEPLLAIHGHWPVGASVALGLGGALLLVLGAKALGAAGLQRPDSGEAGGAEGPGA